MLFRFRGRAALAALALLLGLAAPAAPARADFTIGTITESSNYWPFGGFASEFGEVFQQVYAPAGFPGTVSIGGVTFFKGTSPGALDIATYNLSFYRAANALNAQSANMSANLGALLANWGSFTVGGVIGPELSFTGTPFTYDPTLGPLLMQVTVQSLSSAGSYGDLRSFSDSSLAVRNARAVYPYLPDPVSYTGITGTLVTQFNLAAAPPPAAVPEPGTLALLGLGLAGLAVARRRAATV